MESKKILIFGGAGALGKTLIKRYYNDNEVVIFSRDEHKHYHLLKEYPKVKSIIGDIKDKDSIKNALLKEKPNIVINAAALKHVPVCEDNPYESVKTNIIGHQNVIECVSLCQIETLIFVSTDKACKPINVYGMCKAISEQLYINFAKQQEETKVVIVRYGNVLESTGSVIPYFKNLLKDSYPDSHGKIAVPKVKSLKVTDIADVLIDSYGVDVSLKEIGIRPGEKLHEEMVSSEEWRKTESRDNFLLIGSVTTNDDNHSYNSLDYLMDSSEAHDFLKESGVIK